MKKLISILAATGLVLGLAASASASKPKTVWEDASGDADAGQGLGGSIPGGFDLVSGSIRRDGDNLEFTVTHADMPPSGSLPEGFRFLWGINVDGESYRLSIKSADIGKPDVPAGQTTERVGRVDINGQFRLEGACTTEALGVNFVNCPPLGYFDGYFDAATMSFTAIIPLEAVEAETKSKVGPGAGDLCQICWVSHTAERSLNSSIIDSAGMGATYKVPKK